MRKLKTLVIIAFTLITTSTYGLNENTRHISVKNENSTREVLTTDSVKQIDKSKKQSVEVSIGVFSEGGLNIYFTSWRQIKPWLSFGMGLGLRHYFDGNLNLVPVFVDLKTNLSTKKVSPFLSCKAGYSLGGRFFLNPKLGLSIKTSSKNALNIGLGYEMQQIGTSYYGRSTDNSIGANIGFQF